jgi:hypothetical protein
MNQALLTVQRPLDPKASGYDFGFKFQAMYGSDARYTHFLGEFDQSISGRNQFDIVEAHALFHLPWLTSGGVDVKVGQYVTLEGAEVIYAPDNALYSHSYIFNFGIPFKHTGIMTTTHVSPILDVYAGIDTGVNTTFGNRFDNFNSGDNNKAAAFHGGIGLNLLDGALTVLATTHIGPENPNVSSVALAGINPNTALRYLNDVTIVWKATDKLTLTTDLNYIRDDGFNATGGGVAQYATYALNDWLKITGRGERGRGDHVRRPDGRTRDQAPRTQHTRRLGPQARNSLRYLAERNDTIRRRNEAFAIHIRRRYHHPIQNQMIATREVLQKSEC